MSSKQLVLIRDTFVLQDLQVYLQFLSNKHLRLACESYSQFVFCETAPDWDPVVLTFSSKSQLESEYAY